MSEMKFLTTPWKVHFNNPAAVIPGHTIKTDDDIEFPIAVVWEGGGTEGKPRMIAIANLIAAAPDLLAALDAMDEAFRVDQTRFNAAQANAILLMDRAIAKATTK